MNKKFINAAVIVAFIIGAVLGFIYGEILPGGTIDKHTLIQYTEEVKDKYIHCDYCKGYNYNKYKLYLKTPAIWFFVSTNKDRIICGNCLKNAYIKGLDKILGKPKYLKKRPKELQRD